MTLSPPHWCTFNIMSFVTPLSFEFLETGCLSSIKQNKNKKAENESKLTPRALCVRNCRYDLILEMCIYMLITIQGQGVKLIYSFNF